QKEKNKLIFKNQIKLKNFILKFKPNNNLILDNIDLEINKNESIFIKGESGSGKTSLINLISGIYTPESGDYFLNGKKIENNNISPLTNLGYVTQDTFIFDENIKKNIAIGLHNYEIKLDKINDLIKKVELESFINNLEHGLDTIVGERGARISGGQAQRIGIARALYNDPDILILDEATNSLDKENEFKILKILKKLKDQITIVMISHNPIENIIFDKTYELKNGKLIKIS
ncbi:ATP-binding cassette domain-containing protein, partial [Candidatus Pelagibacter sp.]|nr:ATP-binding cassette domain-containing protein [Candidatus Pelagibacter sp.]